MKSLISDLYGYNYTGNHKENDEEDRVDAEES